ncbi:protein arginine N methyltransferase 7 [Echinococcus multilocularis]|uniref:Protein arginine N methyltransferase 7 n=1 Tax=Echinococcus multilocularis TaxID=6211 RepID=A0A068Y1S4_ECHMU|nr:protein arginine N methyltransferase 7 [Echinococcus multilocularis]
MRNFMRLLSRIKMATCMKSPLRHTLSTFIPRFNPTTGMVQWDNVGEDYDFEQEVAQSAYADMLHDRDRNQRYYEALRHVITSMKAAGREVHVLDIGSGTGLLSMMAARVGADSVIACEAFGPVATCAQRILEANGLQERVKLIHKHSTDLVVGEDMPRKANVLVAELFDTELIGEGALKVYLHAADNLLTPDAILIPCKAKMYLQIVESPFLWSHNQIEPFGGDLSFPSVEMRRCHGSPVVFDLQVSRLKFVHNEIITNDENRGAVRCLLESPLMFHEFNFAPYSSNLKLEEVKRITEVDGNPITACRGGLAHAVIMWWELQMEPSNHVPAITMAPVGTDPCARPGDPRATPAWREHWMQAVYFPRCCPLALSAGEALCVDFSHDAFSIHLDLHRASSSPPLTEQHLPFCHCLTHVAWPRSRFAQLNHPRFREDSLRLTKFVIDHVSALQAPSIALVIVSDASHIPLQVHQFLPLSKATIFHLDSSPMSLKIMDPLYRKAHSDIRLEENVDNLLDSLESFVEKSPTPVEICVISEPFVVTALLPWNSIKFWYVFGQIKERLPRHSCWLMAPTHLRICAVAMDFEHLWKIRAPVGADCEGFDLRLFDKMILSAAAATDAPVEPQPLWQYAGKARSLPSSVFEMSLLDPPTFSAHGPEAPNTLGAKAVQTQTLTLSTADGSSVNAVALWAEWRIADEMWHVVGGPSRPIEVNKEVEWCKAGPHPGVVFLNPGLSDKLGSQKQSRALKVESSFDFYTGEPNFCLSVV